MSRARIILQSYAVLPYNQQTRPLTFFLLPLSYLRAYSIFMGQSSTLFIQFWSSLYFIPFPPPPTLGGGTYAIIGRRSHLKFYYCNLHTWILLHVKTQVRRSEHAHATMLEEWNTNINDVDRICIKGKLQWVDTLENWHLCTERQTIYKLHTIDSSNEIMYLLEYLLFSLWVWHIPLSLSCFLLLFSSFEAIWHLSGDDGWWGVKKLMMAVHEKKPLRLVAYVLNHRILAVVAALLN